MFEGGLTASGEARPLPQHPSAGDEEREHDGDQQRGLAIADRDGRRARVNGEMHENAEGDRKDKRVSLEECSCIGAKSLVPYRQCSAGRVLLLPCRVKGAVWIRH
jgi:hypothetical protein